MQKEKTKNKKRLPYLTKLVMKLAPKIGAKVILEPEWNYAAQIRYKNGVVRSLRYFSLDLNHVGSSDIAKDKDFAKFFIKKLGYPVAHGTTIFEKKWAETVGSTRTIPFALKFAKKLKYPLIVKPNNKSQGTGVFLVYSEKELRDGLKEIFESDSRVAIIEEYMPGLDYRIVVLGEEIISAYERIPLSVIGDGKSSIISLIKTKQKHFHQKKRDTVINLDDSRIKIKIARAGYTLKSVLPKGEKVYLLDNANLSTGGESRDMSSTIHPGFKQIAVSITKNMGLKMCGVDIMVTKGDITKDPKDCKYFVIEINSTPGLDHYVTTGKAQREKVEMMYLKILQELGKKD